MIALVDEDLLNPHKIKMIPNFELMKVANYYFKKKKVVRLLSKEQLEPSHLERYEKIYLFKETKNLKFRDNILSRNNVEYYGYGYFKDFKSLPAEMCDTPADFKIYLNNKLIYKDEELMKKFEYYEKSNLIRLENKDFSHYSKDKLRVFIMDKNPISSIENVEILNKLESDGHNLHFFHSLFVDNEEIMVEMLKNVFLSKNKLIVNFNYDKSFVMKYVNDKITYKTPQSFENSRDINNFILHMTKVLCLSKILNGNASFTDPFKNIQNSFKEEYYILKLLQQWGWKKEYFCFFDFIKNERSESLLLVKKFIESNKELFTLWKSDCKKLIPYYIDF